MRSGIICGPIWGSFPVGDHLRSRDHLRRCTVFLLDFVVCSEPLSQSWVALIVTDLASLAFLTNSAFFSFLRYVKFISSSTSRSSVTVMSSVLPSFLSSCSFFLSIETGLELFYQFRPQGFLKIADDWTGSVRDVCSSLLHQSVAIDERFLCGYRLTDTNRSQLTNFID